MLRNMQFVKLIKQIMNSWDVNKRKNNSKYSKCKHRGYAFISR